MSFLIKKRAYATVPLSFFKYDTFKQHKKPMGVKEKKQPLIICHGLFGSKQNWRSLAKSISVKTQSQVYTIDARNHGDSPHVPNHTYTLMAQDVLRLIKEQGLQDPVLMGHSMGAKVMMDLALNNPQIPFRLVAIDMAPTRITLTSEHTTYVEAMREINTAKLTKQKDADAILQKYEPDLVVRQFLLTNLKKNLKNNGIYEFRIPFELLGKSVPAMGDFFQDTAQKVYEGSTLFITGDLSPYRRQFLKYPALIKAQFPNSRIENIEGAGHWVQTEKPEEFIQVVTDFINEEQ